MRAVGVPGIDVALTALDEQTEAVRSDLGDVVGVAESSSAATEQVSAWGIGGSRS